MAFAMTLTDDTEILEKEIGARIDAAVKADSRGSEVIASLIGITDGALDKIRQGKSTTQYAKLAQLAATLRRSPNQLLGFDNNEREILRGALEGVFEGLGHDQMKAQARVVTVLEVLDTHEVGDPSPNPLERARAIAKYLTQQAVVSQQK